MASSSTGDDGQATVTASRTSDLLDGRRIMEEVIPIRNPGGSFTETTVTRTVPSQEETTPIQHGTTPLHLENTVGYHPPVPPAQTAAMYDEQEKQDSKKKKHKVKPEVVDDIDEPLPQDYLAVDFEMKKKRATNPGHSSLATALPKYDQNIPPFVAPSVHELPSIASSFPQQVTQPQTIQTVAQTMPVLSAVAVPDQPQMEIIQTPQNATNANSNQQQPKWTRWVIAFLLVAIGAISGALISMQVSSGNGNPSPDTVIGPPPSELPGTTQPPSNDLGLSATKPPADLISSAPAPNSDQIISPTINVLPTDQPTLLPTDLPSSDPSFVPSFYPSIKPSYEPSFLPSLEPSSKPSFIPSSTPTRSPTQSPTQSPTKSPTRPPTSSPSMSPTKRPTNRPTFRPSNRPTFRPTNRPTYRPTFGSYSYRYRYSSISY